MEAVDPLRAAFLDELAQSGVMRDTEWLAAFRDVPRDAFVPYFFTQRPGEPGWLLVERPSPEWLEGVYSTRALITQLDGADDNANRARTDRVNGTATSSSSSPLLMALMLQGLNTHAGHRVLEIGGPAPGTTQLCSATGSHQST